MRLVEGLTDRMGHGGAELQAPVNAALSSVLIGRIFRLLHCVDRVVPGPVLASYGLVFGALIGPLLGQLMHAPRMDVGVCLARMRPDGGDLTRGRRSDRKDHARPAPTAVGWRTELAG